MTLANGPLVLPIDTARQMLADCYHWRRIADPTNPWGNVDALKHTHHASLPNPTGEAFTGPELERLMPFALIDYVEGNGYKAETRAPGCFGISGELMIRIFLRVPEGIRHDNQAVYKYALETAGRLYQTENNAQPGLLELANRPDRLSVVSLTFNEYGRVDRQDRATKGDAVVLLFNLQFGGN